MDYGPRPCAQRRRADWNPSDQLWMMESHRETAMLKGQLQGIGHRVLPGIADPGRGGLRIAKAWNSRKRTFLRQSWQV
jgi:hypothetical protein